MLVIFRNNWFISHNILLGMTACVLFFKMHSYSSVNITLRENFLNNGSKVTKEPTVYPNNVTLMNFMQYMVLPTLVYQTNYKLVKRRRVSYLLIKTVLFAFAFVKGYQIVTKYIMAYVREYKQGTITFFELYLREMIPLPILILLLIVMIFDFFCTFVAELTGYPDHQFYEDYWNATTMSEFLSKMNCILPNFFRYHIVYKLIQYNMNLERARIVAFAFSTLVLELLFVFVFKTMKPYMSLVILVNYPMYRYFKLFKDQYKGNLLFLMLYATLSPLVICLYIHEFLVNSPDAIV
eukprot:TRINITY_DN1218_c0_g1_i7.p1 TRINITY_DN1218_c0_g1~~TRINITY_DN1218_c0_g1_i7.p1  ORF type:complete len:294 (-),score=91.68 TRINITY_DN1218_c0_g1_i7:166-1047(-)